MGNSICNHGVSMRLQGAANGMCADAPIAASAMSTGVVITQSGPVGKCKCAFIFSAPTLVSWPTEAQAVAQLPWSLCQSRLDSTTHSIQSRLSLTRP